MSNATRFHELERHRLIEVLKSRDADLLYRDKKYNELRERLDTAHEKLDEVATVLKALLDKVTDIRGIDMELYAPKEITAAEHVIKKIKEEVKDQ